MFLYSVLSVTKSYISAFLPQSPLFFFSFWTGFIVLSYPPMIYHLSFFQPDSIFPVSDLSPLWGICFRTCWTFSHPSFLSKLFFSLRLCWHGLPRGCSGKESTCRCWRLKRLGFDPWVGKSPWKREWLLSLVFLPGKFHGQRSLVGYVYRVAESNTTERLSTHRLYWHPAPFHLDNISSSQWSSIPYFSPQKNSCR